MLYKKHLLLLLLIVISLVPLLDLFHPGLPITHDGQDHVARIANFYQGLSEGNMIPRWAANLNWGYGHPILMFLYPFSSYFSSLFHTLGLSLIDSIKAVFAVSFILSGVFMYLWVREFSDDFSAFFAGALYTIAPYRFIDLYVRGAIGEHVAFIFPPLIAYFLLRLSRRISWLSIVGASFSFAFLILSHNAISLMFLPLLFLYAAYLIRQAKKNKFLTISYLLSVFFGFALSAFFWMPAFFEGRYTLRDIVTVGEYTSRFVKFQDFLFGQWSYGISGEFSVQIGIVQWAIILISVLTTIILYKRKKAYWHLSLGIFFVFWLVLFLMTKESLFIWQKASILQKFQFPWRFLSVAVFASAILGGLFISIVPKKIRSGVTIVAVIVLLIANKNYWHARDYLLKPESFFMDIYSGTTDTGESSPIWSIRFMEKKSESNVQIIEGEGEIKELKRKSTRHRYEMNISSNRARIRENTLYFPGWETLIDGQKTAIEFQDPANRGLITFNISQGRHAVSIDFKETRLRLISDIISMIALLLMTVWSILTPRKLWLRFR